MNSSKENRRKFLKLLFLGTITTTFSPHRLLGFIEPKLFKKGDSLQGIYGISLDDYPELIPIWGSIRIKIENTLMFYPKVIIIHVAKDDYGVDFIAVSERCPHEGYLIKDLDPDLHVFECSGHGTLFDVTGKYIWGPASRDLERLHLEYDGDKTIYLEVPLYPLSKLDEKQEFAFLHQNYPNPCNAISKVSFGTFQLAYIDINLIDSRGLFVQKVFSGFCKNGLCETSFDVSNLSPGFYLLVMKVNGKRIAARKVIVEH